MENETGRDVELQKTIDSLKRFLIGKIYLEMTHEHKVLIIDAIMADVENIITIATLKERNRLDGAWKKHAEDAVKFAVNEERKRCLECAPKNTYIDFTARGAFDNAISDYKQAIQKTGGK